MAIRVRNKAVKQFREKLLSEQGYSGNFPDKVPLNEAKIAFNTASRQRFGKNYTRITHVYRPGSASPKNPGGIAGFFGVKLQGGLTGWINTENMRFWGRDNTLDLIINMDTMAEHYNFYPEDTLAYKWSIMGGKERIELSKWMSTMNWDNIFGLIYLETDRNRDNPQQEQMESIYEMVQNKMDELLARG